MQMYLVLEDLRLQELGICLLLYSKQPHKRLESKGSLYSFYAAKWFNAAKGWEHLGRGLP